MPDGRHGQVVSASRKRPKPSGRRGEAETRTEAAKSIGSLHIFTSCAAARSSGTVRCACFCWEDHCALKFFTKSHKSHK